MVTYTFWLWLNYKLLENPIENNNIAQVLQEITSKTDGILQKTVETNIISQISGEKSTNLKLYYGNDFLIYINYKPAI